MLPMQRSLCHNETMNAFRGDSSILARSSTLRWMRAWWLDRLTPAGRFLFIVTGLFFGYGSTSIDLQVFVPLLYMSVLWVVAFCVMLLERPRAALQVRHAPRSRVGEEVPLEVQVTAQRGGAHDWRVRPTTLPPGLTTATPPGTRVPSLRRKQSATVELKIQAEKRGSYALDRWRVETDYPFGLMISVRDYSIESRLLVHPLWTPLQRLELPRGLRYQPGGVAMAAARGESMEYIGNRDFREGDDVRHIDWRATARLQTPIVREYREEYFLRAAVVLDTFVDENDAESEDYFERAVSLCASVSDYMAREDYLVDLFAAGPEIYHLTSGRSLAYLEQILDILACVEPSHDKAFEKLEPEIEALLAQITTVICVFLDWTPERRDFVARMGMQGAAVKVLLARDTPPTLPADDSAHEVTLVPRTWFESGIVEL